MEKQEILHDKPNHLADREVWYKTPDPDFIDICERSMVSGYWMSYQQGISGAYKASPVKPINNYAANVGLEPELVSIDGNDVRLRFSLYADMFLLKKPGKNLYHVDRPWVRQYYLTDYEMPDSEDCFDGTFKFYVPWFIDTEADVRYIHPKLESPFLIEEKSDHWFSVPEGLEKVSPHFVVFKFKKIGKHMVDEELGIPRRGDPIFDMVATLDDIMVEEIRKHYAKD